MGDLKCHYCKAEGHNAQLHQEENMDFRMKLLTEYETSSFGHFIKPNRNSEDKRRFQEPASKAQLSLWAGTGKIHLVKRLGWKRGQINAGIVSIILI